MRICTPDLLSRGLLSTVAALLLVLSGCASPAGAPKPPPTSGTGGTGGGPSRPPTQPPPPAPSPDAQSTTPPPADAAVPVDAAVNPTDAASPALDAIAPAPSPPDGGSGPDVAPAIPGTPPPLGMRANLEDTVATRWVGTRRTTTMEEGRKVFTGGFEAGKFGGNGNGHIIRFPLAPGSEYILEYRFRFDAGFDFSRGGKIPGMGGGNAPSGCDASTGVGFTARSMWRQQGRLIGYIYDMDQSGECGNAIETGFNFAVGRWYNVKQRIKLNTGGAHDGILQMWIDDRQVINRSNMGWMREAPDRRIDKVFLDFFFGGSTADWSPSRNCSITFTDMFATRVAD